MTEDRNVLTSSPAPAPASPPPTPTPTPPPTPPPPLARPQPLLADRLGEVVSFADEPLILVDPQDREVGHLSKAACHLGTGTLHRAFSVFLFAADGALLLQQRSQDKPLWPLVWSNTCCSHPRRGEPMKDAVHRRLREEVAVESELFFTYKFMYQAQFGTVGAEHELCSVFVGRLEGDPVVNPREVAATRLMLPDALDKALESQPASYTPWLHLEWRALRAHHWPQVLAL